MKAYRLALLGCLGRGAAAALSRWRAETGLAASEIGQCAYGQWIAVEGRRLGC